MLLVQDSVCFTVVEVYKDGSRTPSGPTYLSCRTNVIINFYDMLRLSLVLLKGT